MKSSKTAADLRKRLLTSSTVSRRFRLACGPSAAPSLRPWGCEGSPLRLSPGREHPPSPASTGKARTIRSESRADVAGSGPRARGLRLGYAEHAQDLGRHAVRGLPCVQVGFSSRSWRNPSSCFSCRHWAKLRAGHVEPACRRGGFNVALGTRDESLVVRDSNPMPSHCERVAATARRTSEVLVEIRPDLGRRQSSVALWAPTLPLHLGPSLSPPEPKARNGCGLWSACAPSGARSSG